MGCEHWCWMHVQSDMRKCGGGNGTGGGSGSRQCMGWLCQRSREMCRDIWLVLRVRSFQIIVLQVRAP